MMMNLSGRTALVCGASQGIGGAIADAFAAAGAKVILLSRNAEKLENKMNELAGEGHQYYAVDMADREAMQQFYDYLKHQQIDIVVNNSGGPAPGALNEASGAALLSAFEAHILSAQEILQSVLPSMKVKQFGRVINIVSTSVRIPIPNLGVSNTIRGAMASWAKTISNEVAEFGITVNNILPGLTSTPRLEQIIENTAKNKGVSADQVADEMRATVPMKRFADPSEIAQLALFLASDHAAYITGTSIPIDGGKTGCI